MGTRKRPDLRSDNREGRAQVLELVASDDDARREVPEMPPHPTGSDVSWLEETRDLWENLWESQVAPAVDPQADRGKLIRWAFAWDQWFRTAAVLADKGPVIEGAMGGLVESPLAKYLERQEKIIAAVEKEMGLGPYSRNQLGFMAGQAALTAEELNRRIKAISAGEQGDEDGPIVVDVAGESWADA